MISIIVPCYNEEATIDIFLGEMHKVEELMRRKYNERFEYIFVDDGSTDMTGSKLDSMAEKDTRIKVFHTKYEFFVNRLTFLPKIL